MKKRMCAVCGDTNQTNVKLKWQRFSDNKVFHVCCLCGESNLVNENSVQEIRNKTHTTYVMELPPHMKNKGGNARRSSVAKESLAQYYKRVVEPRRARGQREE